MNWRSKRVRFLAIIAYLGASLLIPLTSAVATPVYSYVSPLDSSTPTTLSSNFDLQYLQVISDNNNLNSLIFVAYFAQPINGSMFKHLNGRKPFGALAFWRTNPGTSIGGTSADFDIYTVDQYLTGNTAISTTVYGNSVSGGTKTTKSNCNAKYWSDLNAGARWIAFSVDKSCATIPDKFWVDFYVDEDEAAGANRVNYDWVSSSALQIDLSVQTLQNPPISSPFTINGVASPSPTPIATIAKAKQTLTGFTQRIFEIKTSPVELPEYSDQSMPITWTSKTEDVCRVSPFANEVFFDDSGSCQLVGTARGNFYYSEEIFYLFLSIWNDYSTPSPRATAKATSKATKKPTYTPTPKKTISGSATATKKPTATPKATVGSKIGGTASGR